MARAYCDYPKIVRYFMFFKHMKKNAIIRMYIAEEVAKLLRVPTRTDPSFFSKE